MHTHGSGERQRPITAAGPGAVIITLHRLPPVARKRRIFAAMYASRRLLRVHNLFFFLPLPLPARRRAPC